MNARDRICCFLCIACICLMAYIALNPVHFTLTLGRAAQSVVETFS